MAVTSRYLAFLHVKSSDSAWKLLRAKHAPLIMAVLDAHFNEQDRRIPVPEFEAMVDADLEELRFKADIDFDRSGHAACEKWRRDGYLVRRPLKQQRVETYELSAGALAAIAYVKQLVKPKRSATQSRMNLIVEAIEALAISSNPDADVRQRALLDERDRIDAQLAALDAGDYEVVSDEDGLEALSDIIALLSEIPKDFAHVRHDFEAINKSLYETIIGYEEGHKDVVENIFSGVDEISQSPSGKSFSGFYALLRDAELIEAVQENIDTIMETSFSDALLPREKRLFRGMIDALLDQSKEVNEVRTSFAQGLRRFVQSQDYRREQLLKKTIDQALALAHKMEAHPAQYQAVGPALELTSVAVAPISRWNLYNPADVFAETLPEVPSHEAERVSLVELFERTRETEIDFEELAGNVNTILKDGQAHPSIADVLDAYPATQGIASVIGLLNLAVTYGRATGGEQKVRWETDDGGVRQTTIAGFEFYREVFA